MALLSHKHTNKQTNERKRGNKTTKNKSQHRATSIEENTNEINLKSNNVEVIQFFPSTFQNGVSIFSPGGHHVILIHKYKRIKRRNLCRKTLESSLEISGNFQ